MQKFGLIKSAKNTTRTVLGAGAFNAEDEDESSIPETLPGRDKRGVALVNQTLSTYNPVNINKTNINVDSSIYDYDAAFEKREEQRASSNLRTHVSAASHASEAPSSNYISDLLKTAQRRDKEREIVHEKKLLRERQAEGQ